MKIVYLQQKVITRPFIFANNDTAAVKYFSLRIKRSQRLDVFPFISLAKMLFYDVTVRSWK